MNVNLVPEVNSERHSMLIPDYQSFLNTSAAPFFANVASVSSLATINDKLNALWSGKAIKLGFVPEPILCVILMNDLRFHPFLIRCQS